MIVVSYIPLAMVLLGGVVWAVRLEGKVATQEQLTNVRDKQADERHQDVKDRLVRIETKLDNTKRALEANGVRTPPTS